MSRTSPDHSDARDGVLVDEREVADVESLSEEIVYTIVENSGKRPQEMSQFREYVNPEALDDLFPLDDDGEPRADARLSFHFEGHHIVIDTNGQVRIQRTD